MSENNLAGELRKYLIGQGASVVAYADIAPVDVELRGGLPVGISIAVALDPRIVMGIANGPTTEYAEEYHRANQLLCELSQAAAQFLMDRGYKAIARDATVADLDRETLSTPVPHKTIATLAGVGWIGKCALLVTEEFGSAIRLNSAFTDAPLPLGEPITESQCGECTNCLDICPGHAPSGQLWSRGMARAELYDAFACFSAARAKSGEIGFNGTICGMCIAACPYTRRALARRNVTENYSKERVAEFLLTNAADTPDYENAREEVRQMGLDSDSITHRKPE